MKFIVCFFIIFLVPFYLISDDHDNETDYGVPGQGSETEPEDCLVNDDSDLLSLLNFKLKKFDPNPKDRSEIGEDPLNAAEVKTNTIRFYQEQLVDFEPIRISIETFTSMGGGTLASLINRSSRISLKHPEKCEFFSLYGDQIIGRYDMNFEKILSLFSCVVMIPSLLKANMKKTFVLKTP